LLEKEGADELVFVVFLLFFLRLLFPQRLLYSDILTLSFDAVQENADAPGPDALITLTYFIVISFSFYSYSIAYTIKPLKYQVV
jgi:hypothetical protein